MTSPLLAFRQPGPALTLPPAASPLLASIALAIECAPSLSDLAEWWQAHQPALRRLSPAELAQAIAAKDARKRHLAGQFLPWRPEDSAA